MCSIKCSSFNNKKTKSGFAENRCSVNFTFHSQLFDGFSHVTLFLNEFSKKKRFPRNTSNLHPIPNLTSLNVKNPNTLSGRNRVYTYTKTKRNAHCRMVDTPVAPLVVQITHIVVKSIRPSLRSESKKWHLKLRVKRDVTRNQTLRTTSWYKCNLYDNIASYYVDFIIDYPPLRIFSHYTIFYGVIIDRHLPSYVFSIVRLAHWPCRVFMREKIFFF